MRRIASKKYLFSITLRLLATGLSLLLLAVLTVSCSKKAVETAPKSDQGLSASADASGTAQGSETEDPSAESAETESPSLFDTIVAAAKSSDIEALQEVASSGIDFNVTNDEGETPLMSIIARFWEVEDIEASVQALIRGGASINIKDKEGKTALDYSLWAFDGPGSNGDDSINLTKTLIDADEARRGKTIDLTTYLFTALSVSAERTAMYFVQKGANPEIADDTGKTLLMCAAEHSMESLVKFLLETGVKLDRQDKKGMTALMYSVFFPSGIDEYDRRYLQSAKNNIVLALLKAGADHRIRNKEGKTAYDLLMQAKSLLGTDAHWELKVLMAE